MTTGTNHRINGFSDLYAEMLEVKNGRVDGGARGFTHITKKQARELNICWAHIEAAVTILSLKIERHARLGYSISKKA